MALDPVSTAVSPVAATGPATAFIEAAAASIGAGMLLGGFVSGLFGLVFGLGSAERERIVVAGSSWAGLAMAVGVVIEAIIR